jgi:hypothetical protein
MVYTVTPNGQPYLDAVEAGKPFRAGYYWDKATDKYVKAPADEIYFSGQPALDRIYDFKKNRIGDKPMIIAVRLTAKDLVDTKLLEMASRQEVFDEPKYFSIDVGFGEFTPGGRVKFPAILDEQTAKMGVDFYALKGEDGKIFTTKVRHSGLGVDVDIPMLMFTTERGIKEGIKPPTIESIKGMAMPTLLAKLSDLAHPHLPKEIFTAERPASMGEVSPISFYKEPWEQKISSVTETSRILNENANKLASKIGYLSKEELGKKLEEAKLEWKDKYGALQQVPAIYDPKVEAMKQVELYHATVDVAKAAFHNGVRTVEEFARELGVEISDIVRRA